MIHTLYSCSPDTPKVFPLSEDQVYVPIRNSVFLQGCVYGENGEKKSFPPLSKNIHTYNGHP